MSKGWWRPKIYKGYLKKTFHQWKVFLLMLTVPEAVWLDAIWSKKMKGKWISMIWMDVPNTPGPLLHYKDPSGDTLLWEVLPPQTVCCASVWVWHKGSHSLRFPRPAVVAQQQCWGSQLGLFVLRGKRRVRKKIEQWDTFSRRSNWANSLEELCKIRWACNSPKRWTWIKNYTSWRHPTYWLSDQTI